MYINNWYTEPMRLQMNFTISAYCIHCKLPLPLGMKFHIFLPYKFQLLKKPAERPDHIVDPKVKLLVCRNALFSGEAETLLSMYLLLVRHKLLSNSNYFL
jgi:hypothetical protein